ncbi:MAG: TetR/AcrR family transcriptional regulator [Caulobacterales bacterium]|nr:TetR/AcrR family transcriptional regulator [Caulobacterales bacterium]
MARPRGVRNPDFEQKRNRLIEALTNHVLAADLKRASLRQFAQAAGVSEPTLRHYFEDRRGVVCAILKRIAERTREFLEPDSVASFDYHGVLHDQAGRTLDAVSGGMFVRAHVFGLIEGAADEELGRLYVTTLLEPALSAFEEGMAAFLDPADPDSQRRRAAALMFFGPMLLTSIHQRLLGGETHDPIDMGALFSEFADAVARAYPPIGEAAQPRGKGAVTRPDAGTRSE